MKYCVKKSTTIVIDGSENSDEVMLQNAENAGFTNSEVEIIDEVTYQQRLALIIKPVEPPTMEERLKAVEQYLISL